MYAWRIERSYSKTAWTSRYDVTGKRVWFENDAPTAALAYGSDVAIDSQGRALVAGSVMQNGKLRGYVFGRQVDVLGPPLFQHYHSAGPGAGRELRGRRFYHSCQRPS